MDVIIAGRVGIEMMTRVDRVPIAGENGLLIDHFDMDNAHLGGSAAAIAIGLRRLGISTAVLSSLGSDGYAAQCLELLKQERVCTDMIVTASDHRTATNLYFVDHAGCRATYYSPTYSALMARELSQYDRFAQEARIGVLSLTGMLPDIEMLKWFRSHDLMIVWVSRGIPSEWTSNAYLEYMHHSDCIVIEQREIAIFKNMLGLATPNDILSEGIQSIICCSGKQGISVIAKKGSGRIAAQMPATTADLLGAEDAFTTGLLFGLMGNMDMLSSAQCGAVMNSFVLEVPGPIDGLPNLARFSRRYHERIDDTIHAHVHSDPLKSAP